MPEDPQPKAKVHPFRSRGRGAIARPRTDAAYAELHVTSNFTFLTGASHPDELVSTAAALGHRAIAITDCNTLAGIVRAHVAAKGAGIPFLVGSRVCLSEPGGGEGGSVLVYPTDRASYGRLCRLLTLGKRRGAKGECPLTLADLIEHNEGLLGVLVPPKQLDEAFARRLRTLRGVFGDDRISLGAARAFGPDDASRIRAIAATAEHERVPLVATNDVHAHTAERRALQDVLTCIRHGCTLSEAGFRLFANAERHLKPPGEMARLFAAHPEAVRRTVEIAERAGAFSLDELRYEYPDEVVPAGQSPMSHLRALTRAGADHRYPDGVPPRVWGLVEHELAIIDELRYAPYFLTVHDIVTFARARGILCQGRGAAANSAVCYCLGVTAVDPSRIDVLFERFVSRERNEPPDIDIDIEHERREEVIQYLYAKYGRERAALTAEVISYRGRSAIREVGKALGLSLDCVDTLAKNTDLWHAGDIEPGRIRELGLDPSDPTIRRLRELTTQIMGFPRHLSQHVGGFVITRAPLCELVPIENAAMPDRTVIEWDKDDIDAMGMLKVDCLGLGMLTCIRKALDLIGRHGGRRLELATIPSEDPQVYDMICAADTVGVFQIESRAQMSMLPRLRPRCFYDLVIEVAIVRPGPIQGDMVHPYLRRRNGEEPVEYPSPEVRRVLEKTLGVPLFQEQAMSLAMVAGGFTPGEADQLRRAMASWGKRGNAIEPFSRKLTEGMLERGYTQEYAERVIRMIMGFSGYGFPESHAASFALLVYASAWLKHRHPAAFACALINSQPMGFYAPAQVIRDAKEHGVTVRPVDVNHSAWDCTLERVGDGLAIRLGMRLVKGLSEVDADRVAAARTERGEFVSLDAVHRRSGARVHALRALASADAFQSIGLDRQKALWNLRSLRDEPLPLFDAGTEDDPEIDLPTIGPPRLVAHDYEATGLSLKAHPMSFVREALDEAGVVPNGQLADERVGPNGKRVRVGGVVLCRQRPGTASGIVFMTIEDETGVANLVVFPDIYARFRRVARHATALIAEGRIERQGAVVHVRVRSLEELQTQHGSLRVQVRNFH